MTVKVGNVVENKNALYVISEVLNGEVLDYEKL